MSKNINDFIHQVVKKGTCTGCGLCVGMDKSGKSFMRDTPNGPRPVISENHSIPELIRSCCAGHEINYPKLYQNHYGKYPDNWLTGMISGVYTGYSTDEKIRRNSSSGGVLTAVLCSLLESEKIDAAIVVTQGIPEPEKASVVMVGSTAEIQAASQSVYVPVSTLDILNKLEPGKRYAMTCLPEQAAAIRVLQMHGHVKALCIRYILGPYTGTAIYPAAIEMLKRINGISTILIVLFRSNGEPVNGPDILKLLHNPAECYVLRKFIIISLYLFLLPMPVCKAWILPMNLPILP